MRKLYKYFLVACLVIFGCSEDEPKKLSDAGYFPLRTGFYQVYAVHEVNYELQAITEDLTYQLKTEVVDSFPNQENGYTYTIHRSKRNTASDPWEFENVWSARMNTANVVVFEENTPFVKISFPAVKNRYWDGNSLNSLPADEYVLTTTGETTLPGLGSTEEVIQIMQEDAYERITFKNKRQEIYARNIGLTYREITDLVYCSTEGQCEVGTQVIDNGTIYVQTLIGYGQN